MEEKKYRPFKSQEEYYTEMMKHQPNGWVSPKNGGASAFICYININCCGAMPYDYKELFNKYTFDDGTPFGIAEE